MELLAFIASCTAVTSVAASFVIYKYLESRKDILLMTNTTVQEILKDWREASGELNSIREELKQIRLELSNDLNDLKDEVKKENAKINSDLAKIKLGGR